MNNIIKDIDGKISSKRTLLFLSFGMLFTSWIGNTFLGFNTSDIIINNITYCIGLGFAAVASEKAFRNKIFETKDEQASFQGPGEDKPEEIIVTHKQG